MNKVEIKGLSNDIHYGHDFKLDVDSIINNKKLFDKKILLVLGGSFFERSEYFDKWISICKEKNIEVLNKVHTKPNPKLIDINNTIDSLEFKNDTDLIVAIGGGSVLDYAKAVKLYGNINVPIFSIYTILGSASIVSPFTVYDNEEFKIGDHSDKIIPEFVYINTEIIKGVPSDLFNAGLYDIFEHSVESYYSKLSNDITKSFALKSLENLELFFEQNKIEDLIYADIFAGLSERIAIVLIPHALGHFLTYKFGVRHGYANFIFFPEFLEILAKNGVKIEKKIITLLQKLPKFVVNDLEKSKITKNDVELIFKYMGFAFVNCPFTPLGIDDIIGLYNNSINKYVKSIK